MALLTTLQVTIIQVDAADDKATSDIWRWSTPPVAMFPCYQARVFCDETNE